MMNPVRRSTVVLLLCAGCAATVSAQRRSPADLAGASLAELMNIEITSASRKEQRVIDTAAAVFVITADDIHRSGLTSVPELLRLAPGVQVARISGSKWAVSVRGFNGLYSNKLLVLVDGRTLYNPVFAGVTWDSEGLMVEDIERIEIVRGPGGAVWGANAVNGVINVVTKSAHSTQGTVVRAAIGSLTPAAAGVRYGATAGSIAYRVYGQASRRDGSVLPPGVFQDDDSETATAGARVDGDGRRGTWMVEFTTSSGRSHALYVAPSLSPTLDPRSVLPAASHNVDTALFGRWTRELASGASVQVESSLQIERRDEPVGKYRENAAEAAVQYQQTLHGRHDVVAGAGYQAIQATLDGRAGYALVPRSTTEGIVNGFVQDEIALLPDRLTTTIGVKVEHHANIGAGVQPTARVMLRLPRQQRVWAAVSRALRTPSLQDRHLHVQFPIVPSDSGLPMALVLDGNPRMPSESVVSVESGYRFQREQFTFDAAAFSSSYEKLTTMEPQTPFLTMTGTGPLITVPLRFDHKLRADARGLELFAEWQPVSTWQIAGGYTAFHLTPHLAADSQDEDQRTYTGNAPRQQWQLRSSVRLPQRIVMSGLLLHSGAIADAAVPAYTRADLSVEFPVTRRLSVMAVGQNLADKSHFESNSPGDQVLATAQPRAARLQVVWRF